MRPFFLLFPGFLLACSDYDLKVEPDAAGDSAPPLQDSAPPPQDTSPPEDTGDTGEAEAEPDPGAATEAIYLNTGSDLFSFDPDTGSLTPIGSFYENIAPISDMTDIAIDLDGRMYGVSFDTLYEIDATNAQVTKVGTLPTSDTNGLTFVSDGTLIATAGKQILTVEPSNAATAVLVDTIYQSSGDIVGLPDGYLYWSVSGSGGDGMVMIDPATGSYYQIGNTGSSSLYALGYAYGSLWAFSATGQGLVIDTTTASVTSSTSVPGVWYGATTNPVLW